MDANSSLTTPGYLARSIEPGLWLTTGAVVVTRTPLFEDTPVVELEEIPGDQAYLQEMNLDAYSWKTAPPMVSHLAVGGVIGGGVQW